MSCPAPRVASLAASDRDPNCFGAVQIDSLMAQRAQLETGLRAKSQANDELTQVCRHRSDSSSILTPNTDHILLLACYAGGRFPTSTPILVKYPCR